VGRGARVGLDATGWFLNGVGAGAGANGAGGGWHLHTHSQPVGAQEQKGTGERSARRHRSLDREVEQPLKRCHSS